MGRGASGLAGLGVDRLADGDQAAAGGAAPDPGLRLGLGGIGLPEGDPEGAERDGRDDRDGQDAGANAVDQSSSC